MHPEKNKKLNEAISSFIDYKWDFPQNKKEKFLNELIAERARIKKPHTMRFNSIHKVNISRLSKELFRIHGIESNIYLRVNGQGRKYFELAIYKEKHVKKLVDKGLLSKKQLSKLGKVFK